MMKKAETVTIARAKTEAITRNHLVLSESFESSDLSEIDQEGFVGSSLADQPVRMMKRKKILIVDDELFNLQAMMIVLKAAAAKLGYSPEYIDKIVDQELSGKEALRQVQNNKYKLIITDLSSNSKRN